MNLEELKHIWQAQSQALGREENLPEAALRAMLQQRSHSALDKINRSILLEVVLVLLIGAGGFWLFGIHRYHSGGLALMALTVAGSLLFYYYKYRLLNRDELSAGDLKYALSALVRRMQGFMRGYQLVIWFGIPVIAIIGLLAGAAAGAAERHESLSTLSSRAWLLLGVAGIAYIPLAILFSRWYLRRLYGIHFEELASCLAELEEHA